MLTTDGALSLIESFEGLRLRAYRDAAGVWTIGYGHTSAAGPPRVVPGMTVTEAEAETILRRDVEAVAQGVRALLSRPVNANQFGALVSFAFNVGLSNFRRSSVLSYTNAGRFDEVPARFDLWIKSGGRVLRGLVRRRKAEGELFATPAGV